MIGPPVSVQHFCYLEVGFSVITFFLLSDFNEKGTKRKDFVCSFYLCTLKIIRAFAHMLKIVLNYGEYALISKNEKLEKTSKNFTKFFFDENFMKFFIQISDDFWKKCIDVFLEENKILFSWANWTKTSKKNASFKRSVYIIWFSSEWS